MNPSIYTDQASVESVKCPYCGQSTSIDLPVDYAPVYAICGICRKKFIVERLAEGFQVMTREEAPCCSDPDCRDIEMGGGDEE